MFENSGKRRKLAILGSTLAVIALGLTQGCGGKVSGFGGHAEFAYLATGTNIVQFAVSTTGQLVEQIPNTAPSASAVAIATTSDNRFAYAANFSGTVSQYAIGGDGLLHPLNPATVPVGVHPHSIIVTPNAKFAYVFNNGDGTISEFSIASNGQLSALNPATVTVGATGTSLAITPNGNFVYASNDGTTISAFSVGANGQLTPLAVPTYTVAGPSGQAVSLNGNFLYVPMAGSTVAQFAIAVDGSLSPLTPATVATPGPGADAVGFTPAGGFAYVGVYNGGAAGSPVAQFSVGGDGTLTALAPASVAAGGGPVSVAVDPSGKFAYVANGNDGTVSEFSIGVDGKLTALIPASINPNGAMQFAFARK